MSAELSHTIDLHMQRQAEIEPINTRLNELTWDILPAQAIISLGVVGAAALFGRFVRDPSKRKASLASAALLAAGTLVEALEYRNFIAEDEALREERAAVHNKYDQQIVEQDS